MADIPDDLTSVGTHRGNQSPVETGQTVRSPEGPDPNSTDARPSPALFQVVTPKTKDRVTVEAHSARAKRPDPDDAEHTEEYHTVEDLREALTEIDIEGWAAVFEDAESGKVLVDTDVSVDHAWIGQPRYPRITFFADSDDATAFAESRDELSSEQ